MNLDIRLVKISRNMIRPYILNLNIKWQNLQIITYAFSTLKYWNNRIKRNNNKISYNNNCNYLNMNNNLKLPKGFERFNKDNDSYSNTTTNEKKKINNINRNNNKSNKVDIEQSILFMISSLIGFIIYTSIRNNNNKITFQEFLSLYLSKGLVERIIIFNGEIGRAYLKSLPNELIHTKLSSNYDDTQLSINSNSEYTKLNNIRSKPKMIDFTIGSLDSFERQVRDIQIHMGIDILNHIPIEFSKSTLFHDFLRNFIPTTLGLLFTLSLLRIGSRSLNNNNPDKLFRMGRIQPIKIKDIKSNVKFGNVAGMKEAKNEIQEFVDFLKEPKRYEFLGAKIPKGALLVGPPGTGKTLLAKAVAGEANVPFFSISGSDFIEIFVGIGPSRVRDLFFQAQKNAPSIIFIDEIDAIGKKRGIGGFANNSNDERENTLNQLLVEMDGFTSKSGIIVLAGTNRADILDPALIRPGRFDRIIIIDKPDLQERKEIFQVHLKPLKLNSKLNIDELSNRLSTLSSGFTGSEIANICNEAAIFAARRNTIDGIDIIDFEQAIERIIGGLKKNNNYLSFNEKRIVSFHEAGHTIVGWFLKNTDPILKVSIIPRTNGALGFAQILPSEVNLYTKDTLLDKLAVLLGGRASEELFIGTITTGAIDDLQKATKIANDMILHYGMNSNIGLVSYFSMNESLKISNLSNNSFYKPFSEATAQIIDKETNSLLIEQFYRAKRILQEKKNLVYKLSNLLIEKETLTIEDITECIGPRIFDNDSNYSKYIDYIPKTQ
ncbi:AFG3 ATP-dependent protease family protein [Cryptosporidium muris RN66]|uniref:AFG3 ATP-dependent protease family protein n=1 Tax=Cryptosporidium muris (strain RN66) TaxID=441375 RepID=B6AIA1_CRYMR|nr:AFG3 ATP-dependent protease family protein [Cryptosporidium muris RN66]EEA07942.1 AFG3 ATP-dependent protease family protein [Cryptosporidium muris RN66]|eukprot:XP_002142291.1 AFG3 ATP-dependent protease family protein [Cryptosporidium muris RN66]